jgi:hypothetical protein
MESKQNEREKYAGVLNFDEDWQRIKDLMTFLEKDEEREDVLKRFILSSPSL